jgi:predicted RNA polymerase sigma factor
MPDQRAHVERLGAVLHVLYLIFNEGYTASSGPDLQRPDLATEAVRLTRAIHRSLPDDGEVAGLLALMLLTDARRAARTDAAGGLIPLAKQDRSRWDSDMIEEGTRLVTDAMLCSPLGPYQLQAAIASLHVQALHAADTDWQQIRFLYQVLCRIAPNPMATLNHAIAVAMTDGPDAGLAMLSALAADDRMARHHRLTACSRRAAPPACPSSATFVPEQTSSRRGTRFPDRSVHTRRCCRLRTELCR